VTAKGIVNIRKCLRFSVVAKNETRPRGRPSKFGEDVQPFVLRLPRSLHEDITRLAKDAEVSLNDLLLLAVREWRRSTPRPTPARIREAVGE
jgi:hypothetical protein